MLPIVQISLDIVTIDEAVSTAEMALRAGVDWLEAGTPLIIAEGMNGVRALRERFPTTPIVADLKTMDGGYLEAELMAQAGATHVVVMERAHEETIRCVVKAGHDFGIEVMGDNLACEDMVAGRGGWKIWGVTMSFTILDTMNDAGSRPAGIGCRVRSINCERWWRR